MKRRLSFETRFQSPSQIQITLILKIALLISGCLIAENCSWYRIRSAKIEYE